MSPGSLSAGSYIAAKCSKFSPSSCARLSRCLASTRNRLDYLQQSRRKERQTGCLRTALSPVHVCVHLCVHVWAEQKDLLIPALKPQSSDDTYEGATVIEPKKGFYRSLAPSLLPVWLMAREARSKGRGRRWWCAAMLRCMAGACSGADGMRRVPCLRAT